MLDVMLCACTQEAKAGGLCLQGHPRLYTEFQASLDYMSIPCLKTKQNKTKTTKFFQGFTHAKQVLYHLSCTPSSFACILFLREALLTARAGLELAILLPLPLNVWDYQCTPPCLA
jgi:hypothetical protein